MVDDDEFFDPIEPDGTTKVIYQEKPSFKNQVTFSTQRQLELIDIAKNFK